MYAIRVTGPDKTRIMQTSFKYHAKKIAKRIANAFRTHEYPKDLGYRIFIIKQMEVTDGEV